MYLYRHTASCFVNVYISIVPPERYLRLFHGYEVLVTFIGQTVNLTFGKED